MFQAKSYILSIYKKKLQNIRSYTSIDWQHFQIIWNLPLIKGYFYTLHGSSNLPHIFAQTNSFIPHIAAKKIQEQSHLILSVVLSWDVSSFSYRRCFKQHKGAQRVIHSWTCDCRADVWKLSCITCWVVDTTAPIKLFHHVN